MTDPEFLERDVVLFLHDQALRMYGGIYGMKVEGLLDSARGRPLNKLAYADPPGPDLFELAAAYAFGLASNHAFNDGNKRTAWSCCVLFRRRTDAPCEWRHRTRSNRSSHWSSGVLARRALQHGCLPQRCDVMRLP